MSSRHRDPCDDNSTKGGGRSSASAMRRVQSTPLAAGRDSGTGRCSSGGQPKLIVTRGLYSLLEDEIQGSKTPRKVTAARKSGVGSRPQFLFCYLCGQQFSRASLPIHQPQCYVKKLIEWERMDPLKRGPRPVSPKSHEENLKAIPAVDNSLGKVASKDEKLTNRELDRFNELQIEHFNKNMLLMCDTCRRTFLPDRLEVHQRSCKPGRPGASKPVGRTVGSGAVQHRSPRVSVESVTTRLTQKLIPKVATGEGEAPVSDKGVDADEREDTPSPLDPSALRPVSHISDGSNDALGGTNQRPTSVGRVDLEAAPPARNHVEMKISPSSVRVESAVDATDPNARGWRTADAAEATTPRVCSPSRNDAGRVRSSLKSSVGSTMSRNDRISVNLRQSDAPPSSEPAGNTSFSQDSRGADDEVSPSRPVKKIQLNNVSHFKNVRSRLNLGVQRRELPRCQFCDRTFHADRLEKHESVCVVRHKIPPKSARPSALSVGVLKDVRGKEVPLTSRAASGLLTLREQIVVAASKTPQRTEIASGSSGRPSLEVAKTPRRPTVSLSTEKEGDDLSQTPAEAGVGVRGVIAAGAIPKLHFCFECGVKLPFEFQRFCSECGTKLVAD